MENDDAHADDREQTDDAKRATQSGNSSQAPSKNNNTNEKSSQSLVRHSIDNRPAEHGGPKGPEPTRYGDWERNGRCYDF